MTEKEYNRRLSAVVDRHFTPLTEADLATLSDADLLALHQRTDPDDPALDLICGEIERRNLDE